MKKNIFFKCLLGLIVMTTVSSCHTKPTFVIEGQITGADSSVVYLEKRGFTDVTTIDSVQLKSDGKFKFEENKSENSDFYLLRLNNQMINLAVDSTETIKITASKKTFATTYTVDGSANSQRMKENILSVYKLSDDLNILKSQYNNKIISDTTYENQTKKLLEAYKAKAQKLMFVDLKSLASYFILFQQENGALIYNPYDKNDSKMFSAVATSWDVYRKDEPRTKHLHDFVINAIRQRRSQLTTTALLNNPQQTDMSDYYEINLPDVKGDNHKLSALKGKIVLLDFTAYEEPFSVQHNSAINLIYKKYKDQITIYQVSFDSDLNFWQNAASNLPWISVRDGGSSNSELIKRFNITSLPTTYLVDKAGNIVKRLSPKDNVDNEIKKLL